jgi:hypothetical protein
MDEKWACFSVVFLHAYLSIGCVWWLYTCHCEKQWQYYFTKLKKLKKKCALAELPSHLDFCFVPIDG